MGCFYTNLTVGSDDADAVADALRDAGRTAFVTPPSDGSVVVFDQQCDEQDEAQLAIVGKLLSNKLNAPVLGVIIHDDDVLLWQLYLDGQIRDSYDSCPAYFSGVGPEFPQGGDARLLAESFNRPAAMIELESVLRSVNPDQYVSEMDRHEAIVSALKLPSVSVGMGYTYIEQDPSELEGVLFEDLIRVV